MCVLFHDRFGCLGVLLFLLQKQNVHGQMIMTSMLTFVASVDHHNQSITCSASYLLTNGSNTQPSATTQRLSVLCETQCLCELILTTQMQHHSDLC